MQNFTKKLTKQHSHTKKFTTYLPDNSSEMNSTQVRPTILICPGGGYEMTSDREAEPIALQIAALNYNAFVLRYSVAPARYPVALLEAAEAMKQIRTHAKEWQVDTQAIIIAGFSAGGHLAANLATQWNRELSIKYGYAAELIKPNGLFLAYAVLTSGKYAHHDSIKALLGERYGQKDLMEKVSLEKQVTAAVPPTFIWHTATDDLVPVENALLFVQALRQVGISFEMHIFPKGGHGLSLATANTVDANGYGIEPQVAAWFGLFATWLKTNF